MLFIRGCKSSNPNIRLRSIYRRYYLSINPSFIDGHISNILAKICIEHNLASILDIIEGCNPSNQYLHLKPLTYSQLVNEVLIHKIRFTAASDFIGMSTPTKFK